ncbi:MAG TPA: aminotransferase class I/II-fold pyridoxal phosphate-dependent enzyme [Solirubrobacterales bacterium]
MSRSKELRVPPLSELHSRRGEKWAGHDPDVISMTIAEMDFEVAAPITKALRAAVDRSDFGYAPAGPVGMNEALAGFARRRLDWEIDPEQVTLVPDVVVAIVESCKALLRPGDAIALATPAYPPFFAELPRAGFRLAQLPTDRRGDFALDDLEAALRAGARALILVNPQNPSGRVIPRSELSRIAELCAEHEAWVLADEIHAPLVLPGATQTPWLEVSDAAREFGICTFSASKAFNLAGLKAAQLVTASPRARDAAEQLGRLSSLAGLFGVIASEAAFGDGDEWLDAALAQLATNREQLAQLLREQLPEIDWMPPEGTYLAWLDCRGLELGEDPAARFLERGRVRPQPGARLRTGRRRLRPAELRDEPGIAHRGGASTCGGSAVASKFGDPLIEEPSMRAGVLNLEVAEDGGRRVIRLSGEFDLANASSLEAELERALGGADGDGGGGEIVVDMEHLSFIDSTGIAVLIRAVGHDGEGRRLRFVPSKGLAVQRVLRVTGLEGRLPLLDPPA